MPKALKQDGQSLHPTPVPAAIVLEGPGSDQPPDDSESHLPAGPGLASVTQLMAPLQPAGWLGSRDQIQAELDGIGLAVRSFALKQPDQVMREVAAYSARLTELVVLLHRVEDRDRQYTQVRTRQVEKWLAELDRQFKIASRIVEVQRQDLALLNGQV